MRERGGGGQGVRARYRFGQHLDVVLFVLFLFFLLFSFAITILPPLEDSLYQADTL